LDLETHDFEALGLWQHMRILMDSDEESDEPLRLHLVLGAVVLVRSSYVVLPRMSYVILFFKYKLVNKHMIDLYIYIHWFVSDGKN
jgi:hypothetical protein